MSSQSNLSFDAEAYAARKRAREASKVSGREFVLYVPSSLSPSPGVALSIGKRAVIADPAADAHTQAAQQRVLRTGSLKLIIAQLDFALKRAAKLRKPPKTKSHHHDLQTGPPMASVSVPTTPSGSFTDLQRLRKGKARMEAPQLPLDDGVASAQRAWWLDVSSPSWDDLRALGKLLHIHPLTLEDIAQRDPREKLELFPKLGYYFVSFRAIESDRSREKAMARRQEQGDAAEAADDLAGVNMYLVVFREGICAFHFEDVAEHTERVRKKVLELQSTLVMSSDFVCHGILDSIVDGFFPIFHAIERETDALDSLIIQIGANTDQELKREHGMGEIADLLRTTPGGAAIEKAAKEDELDQPRRGLSEKDLERISPAELVAVHSRKLLRRASEKSTRLADALAVILPGMRMKHRPRGEPTQTMKMLLRMTRTRRLVTTLGRLLAAKSEVIAQLQKRLIHSAGTDLDWGGTSADIAAYFGDVQDHIIFLQQSLAHYERILGHSHPAYLSHLRISFSQARGGVDKAVVALTAVTMIVLCMQGTMGTCLGPGKSCRDTETSRRDILYERECAAQSRGWAAVHCFWLCRGWRMSRRSLRYADGSDVVASGET